jgi:multisubunit Na+/H+ antiporter MnhF subunit
MSISVILLFFVAAVTLSVYRFVRGRLTTGAAWGVAVGALGLQLFGLWVMAELTLANMG